jgi:hypothetical protein
VATRDDSSRFEGTGQAIFSSPRVAIGWTPEGQIVYNDRQTDFATCGE